MKDKLMKDPVQDSLAAGAAAPRAHPWASAGMFAAALLAATGVLAQSAYPTKPVRVIVPFAPGGANDLVIRVFGERLQKDLGQPFVVENRPGANGNIAAASAEGARDLDVSVDSRSGGLCPGQSRQTQLRLGRRGLRHASWSRADDESPGNHRRTNSLQRRWSDGDGGDGRQCGFCGGSIDLRRWQGAAARGAGFEAQGGIALGAHY